eukprot:g15789.t1
MDGAEDGDTPPETTRAPGDAHMAVCESLDGVQRTTAAFVAAAQQQKSALNRDNEELRGTVVSLEYSVERATDRCRALMVELDLRETEMDEERQLLASCEADFATAASSASRLAYDVRAEMFDVEGIDVSAAPPDASVIPDNGLPTPGESFAKLLVNIEHVRSVMATYANHPRCLDKRVAETSDVGGDGEVGLEELVRYPPSDLVPGDGSSAGIEEAVSVGIGADSSER